MATLSASPEPEAPEAAPATRLDAVAVPAIVAEACPSCGAALAGDWCHACGERRPRDDQFSVRHFFREVGAEVFDFDGRALRSLRLLLTRPGFLTLEVLQGRRRLYLGAFKMYLAVFAALMLLAPLMEQPGEGQKTGALAARLTQLTHSIAVHRGVSDVEAERAFLAASLQHESWVSIIIPLVFAAMLFGLFRRRRAWFGEHLLFATHFATFNYVFALVLVPAQLGLSKLGLVGAAVIFLASTGVMLAYLAVAFRRVYGGGRAASIGWGLALMLAFSIAQAVAAAVAVATAYVRLIYL